MSDVPNINFFIGYVDNTRGLTEDSEYKKIYGEQRRFYSSTKDNDYLKYVQTGSNDVMDYVEYSGNKEKSHGVFNQFGLMKPESMKILRKQLRKTESVIWHGVISFTEEFGDEYCDSYEKAYKMMKTEMPKFFKNCHLDPDNIVWFAGLHENTDNKHIHFSFFEKSPKRYKITQDHLCYSDGYLPEQAINKSKVSMELTLKDLSRDISNKRKLLTEEMKNQLGDYMKNLQSLVIILPREGRLQYDSENIKTYKPYIDVVINTIISNNEKLSERFNTFDKIISQRDTELLKAYSKLKLDGSAELLRDKYYEDIYRRLGNIVLHTVKQIRMEQDKVTFETKKRLELKRIEKNRKKILLNRCMALNDLVNQEIVNAFEEYREMIAKAHYSRLKEEGYLD